ncbi:uncharacterized protein EI97DRAFT_453990 [Westerdykella ornata]|uniref:Uncharacterized protein n=1 Tax=Westerdykella ornata TaxID=318751 RepID=A0A6A6K071_WESOR|nr:uncharacterized protein EI97DRAFT_453990 [Westerdykella ornata]KAF2280739.1 hypothetical protein EI97DRAFT_453990 [Westerdykella ornata]
MSSQSTSPFFTKFPREIRDQIYHEIWLQTPLITFSSPHFGKCDIIYEGSEASDTEHPDLSWLRSCKQMYSEGMEQHYRKSRAMQGVTGPVEEVSEEPNHPGEWMLLRCKELHLGLNTFLTHDMAGDMTFRETWIIADCDKRMLLKLRQLTRSIAPAWKMATVHMILNFEAADCKSFHTFWNTFPAINWDYLGNLLAGRGLDAYTMLIRHHCPPINCHDYYCPLIGMETAFGGELSAFGRRIIRRARVETSDMELGNQRLRWVYGVSV